MSFNRRYFDPSSRDSNRGPSDEMLAVDAASELRSLTLLYERYADRLYRYFLVCTGDSQDANRLLRNLISLLPQELQRYGSQDKTFAGWIFGQASRLLWREYSFVNRTYQRLSRFLPHTRSVKSQDQASEGYDRHHSDSEHDIIRALGEIGPNEREVIGLSLAAGLPTLPMAEALRLPASLVSSHVEHALQALGQHVGTSNTKRLGDDAREVFAHQRLSEEQRRGHHSLIHGLFYGEVVNEVPEEEKRGPALEIAALVAVVLVGLIGLWVWGLVAPGDTRQHEGPGTVVEADVEPDPTVTPESTPTPGITPTPEEDPVLAGEDAREICLAADGKARFDQFVRRYNQGDFDQLRAMLPSPNYDHPLLQGDSEADPEPLQIFVHHEVSLAEPDEIVEYLEERHQAGERWDVLEAYPAEHYRNWQGAAPLEMYQDWKRKNPGYGLIIVAAMDWSGSESNDEIARGRVMVDCAHDLIIDWNMQPDQSQSSKPVSVDDLLTTMTPLEPGESRQIRARVRTDFRDDGSTLKNWELIWSEAMRADGELVERVEVRQLDGGQVINYVNDGRRWRVEQRNWLLHGGNDDELPLPEEIGLPLPWIKAVSEVITDEANGLEVGHSMRITRDLSHTAGATGERWFEVEVQEGLIEEVRLRETGSNGERIHPRIKLLGVSRSTGYDPGEFEVSLEPRFPEKETDAPRYRVPIDAWPELNKISMSVGNDPAREEYRLRWNEVEFKLTVRPSRGGLDPNSIPEGVDESWTTAAAEYSYGTLVWAHRHFAGYPTDAIWDDGLYRFEIAVDRDAISSNHNWNLGQLIRLANALSNSNDRTSLSRNRVQDREASSSPSMAFNH